MKKTVSGWLILAVLLSGCSTPQPAVPIPESKEEAARQELALLEQQKATILGNTAPAGKQADAATPSPASQRVIQAGDKISVEVWLKDKVSQLAGYPLQVTVPDSGDVFLPHLGTVQVAGHTYSDVKNEVQQQLNKILSESFLVLRVERERIRGGAGQSEVALGEHIVVLGWVNSPGVYPLNRGLRVRDAIALAGGFKHYAHYTVYLVRGESDHPEVVRVDMSKVLKGKDLTQNVELAARDAIYVAPLKMWEISDFVATMLLPIVAFRDAIYVYDRMSGQ